ncbi:MAG: 50S ribosomal protein L21e [Candidatus Thermoplasmatota archaeon]|jgi:large subunit ribosomal protein L21e|nr:50S ribosomal protein L21e [Candidatus Thermoplasmatota archaeon]MCL5984204.1 50S ribosomal protein L21e [Candidatus Thermoplasmatota archaeon]
MVKSSKGFNSRTRGILTKKVREKGLPAPSHFVREFPEGSKVIIRLEASFQKGMPHPRYQGKVGVIVAQRGRCFEVEFYDGGKRKMVLANPVHLVPMESKE